MVNLLRKFMLNNLYSYFFPAGSTIIAEGGSCIKIDTLPINGLGHDESWSAVLKRINLQTSFYL